MDISFVTRKFRKGIAGFTILALLSSFASFGVAFAEYSDVAGHWGEDYIMELTDQGVFDGEGEFRPNEALNRAEAAKIAVLTFLGEDAVSEDYIDGSFSDVSEDDWFAPYVYTAKFFDIIGGYTDADGVPTGEFGPADGLNRAEYSKMVVNAAGLSGDALGSDTFNDVPFGAWFDNYVGLAYEYMIVDGKSASVFAPADPVTRAESAKMAVGGQNPTMRPMDDMGGEDEEEVDDMVVADGTLLVSLSAESPMPATVPSNATAVAVAAFDFTAVGGDILVNDLVFHQYALTNEESKHSVYLYEGAERLTDDKSINTTSGDVRFINLGLVVSEGETRTFTLRTDIGQVSDATELGFRLREEGAVSSTALDVDGTFPVTAARHEISTTSVGNITFERTGSITDPTVGEQDAIVARFRADVDSEEGVYLERMAFEFDTDVDDSEMTDFKLYISGVDEAVAMADMIGREDLVTFSFETPYFLEKGSTKSMYITHDFVTGEADDVHKVFIKNASDIHAVGDKYGFNVGVTNTAYNGTSCTTSAASPSCSISTVLGGDITATNGDKLKKTFAPNQKDVVIADIMFTTTTDITLKTLPVSLTVTETAANTGGLLANDTAASPTALFTDIKIIDLDTGAELMSAVDSTSFTTDGNADETTQTYTFSDDLFLSAGTILNLALTADIENDTQLDGSTITGSFNFSSSVPEIEDENGDTLNNATVLVPNSSIAGPTHDIEASGLALSIANTPAAGGIQKVQGADDVKFLGINFDCADARDCLVTDVALKAYIDDDNTAPATYTGPGTFSVGVDNSVQVNSLLPSVRLELADGTVVAENESIATSTGEVNFDNINWMIEAGDNPTVFVVGDLESTINGAYDRIAFQLTSTSDVVAEDDDGSGITPTGTVNTTPTTWITVSQGGALALEVDSSGTPSEDILASGSMMQTVSTFKFESGIEDAIITDLAVNNQGTGNTSIAEVYLQYVDSEGVLQTKAGGDISSEGVVEFSNLDLYVPEDDDAEFSVLVDIHEKLSGFVTGETIDFNVVFSNFEAIAGSSQETYSAARVDADSGLFSFGTLTGVADATGMFESTDSIGSAGTNQTLNLATANTTNYEVGTLLFNDNDGDLTHDSNEALFVVTSSSTTTPTVEVLNDNTTTYVLADSAVVAALPGTGYFTATNQAVLYETKLMADVSPDFVTGGKTAGSLNEVFELRLTADEADEVTFRPSLDLTTCVANANSTLNSDNTTDIAVDGSSCSVNGLDGGGADEGLNFAVNNSDIYDSATSSAKYNYVSFWFRWDDNGVDAATTLLPSHLAVFIDDANPGNGGAASRLSATQVAASNIAGSPSSLLEGNWYLVRDVAMPTTNLASATSIGVVDTDGNTTDNAADLFYVDGFRLYNEKIEFDIDATDLLDLGNDSNTTGGTGPVSAELKNGSDVVATGYVDVVALDSNADNAISAADADADDAILFFVPSTTEGEISVDSGEFLDLTVELGMADLINENTSVDDNVSFQVNAGSSTNGVVTPGGLWWYTGSTTVKWLGDVDSSSIRAGSVYY